MKKHRLVANIWELGYAVAISSLLLMLTAVACSQLPVSLPFTSVSSARGPGPFDLTKPTQGLEGLDAYRATLLLKFDGTRNSQSANWSQTYTLAATKKPKARLLIREITGSSVSTPKLTAGEIEGVGYTRQGDKPCAAVAIKSTGAPTSIFEPAQILPSLLGAEQAGASETLAGLPAKHHRFDQRALGLEQAKASGDVWVAADAGLVIKYLLQVEASEEYFGEGVRGTMRWEYQLSDVNQAFSVEPPAGCPLGLVDVPRLANATNVVNQPGFLSYKTNADIKSAVDFYQEQLPAAGWQAAGDPVVTNDMAVLGFTRADHHLSIVITAKGGTTVRITLERRSP